MLPSIQRSPQISNIVRMFIAGTITRDAAIAELKKHAIDLTGKFHSDMNIVSNTIGDIQTGRLE